MNTLIVNGAKESLDKIEGFYTSSGEDEFGNKKEVFCNRIIPVEPRDADVQTQKWGSKWDIYDASVVRDGDENLTMSFFTAWTPIIPVIEKLIEMFPDCEFDYQWSDFAVGAAWRILRLEEHEPGSFMSQDLGQALEEYFKKLKQNFKEENPDRDEDEWHEDYFPTHMDFFETQG
jgi:hypothetical protein